MGVSLYTSRVVLNVLGINDYGIYNVVGGLVAMFAIFSNSLSGAISRFLSFELGKNDGDFKKVFNIAVIIQLGLAIVISLLIETIGVWFLNNEMNIDIERIRAANWVLQCSTITFIVNMLAIPYNSAIISFEKMEIFAYISIVEVILKLGVVFILKFYPFYDNLEAYAVMILIVSIIPALLYRFYCTKNFEGCKIVWVWDSSYLKNMLGFSGWNFLGVCASICRDQGVNMIVNILFGTTINAARGIATQVCSAVNGFVGNFMKAVDPQITKMYASGEVIKCHNLVFRSSKFGFMLIFFVTFPILINSTDILKLWLSNVPPHAPSFVTLILIFLQVETLTYAFNTLMLATAKIKTYQIVAGGIQLLNLPISYFLLKAGFSLNSPYYLLILLSIVCFAARIYLLRSIAGISAQAYFKTVILRLAIMVVFILPLPLISKYLLPNSFVGLLVNVLICMVASSIGIVLIGCSRNERVFIFEKTLKIIKSKL